VVQLVAVGLFFGPFSHCVVHVAVDFYGLVAQSWMVKSPENVVQNFVDWNTWVLPGIENTSGIVS
jgi:hypothetical protein